MFLRQQHEGEGEEDEAEGEEEEVESAKNKEAQGQPAIEQDWENTMPKSALPVFDAYVGVPQPIFDPDLLLSPQKIFGMFITDEMLRLACDQTNLYYHQQQADNVENSRNLHVRGRI